MTTVEKSVNDTIIPKATLEGFKQDINRYRGEASVLRYELTALKDVERVDTFRFGNDSLIMTYIAKSGIPLMQVMEKFSKRTTKKDSIVSYFNSNGLVEYTELWHEINPVDTTLKSRLPRMSKLTHRRYEYDRQKRLVREVVNYPTPLTMEYTYTYDSTGKQIKTSEKISPTEFWTIKHHD